MMLERLHIGTSGWSYQHWSGLFYPEGVKPAKYLEYHVTQFSCVELNAGSYRVPGSRTVAGWLLDGREVWASFNNDIDGHAVHNACDLRALATAACS